MADFERVVEVRFTISGKLFYLFQEWLKNTKLSDQKLRIIDVLEDIADFVPLEHLHDRLGLSFPLISYHINGNLKSEGLLQAEIVEKKDIGKGQVGIKLTDFGRLVLDVCREDKHGWNRRK